MKVKELIALLSKEGQEKEIRLEVHTGDSVHNAVEMQTDSITNIREEKGTVWICYKPAPFINVYSAGGFPTLIEDA